MPEAKDVLYLVLAACVFILTGFFAWLLYYFIRIVRTFATTLEAIHEVVASIKERLERLDELLRTAKEKLSASASYFSLLAKAGKDFFDYLQRRRSKKGNTSK